MIMRQKWKWDILEEFSNSLTYDEKVSIFWLGGKGWAFSADFAPISACGFLLQISQGHTLLVTSFLVDFHARTNINCHWMWIFRQKSGRKARKRQYWHYYDNSWHKSQNREKNYRQTRSQCLKIFEYKIQFTKQSCRFDDWTEHFCILKLISTYAS